MEKSRFLVAGFYKRTCGVRVSRYQTLKDWYSKTGTAHDILHEHLWQRYDANVLSSYQALKDLEKSWRNLQQQKTRSILGNKHVQAHLEREQKEKIREKGMF